jgi:hypothetical protein
MKEKKDFQRDEKVNINTGYDSCGERGDGAKGDDS